MVARLTNLSIEMAGTRKEASEGLAAALEMEMELEEDRGSKGKKVSSVKTFPWGYIKEVIT